MRRAAAARLRGARTRVAAAARLRGARTRVAAAARRRGARMRVAAAARRRGARMRVAAALLAGACSLAGATAARADDAPSPAASYLVKPGDTCVTVAKALWPDDPHALAHLHWLNPELGPLPHTLAPGTVLHARPAAPDARLTFVRPLVEARLSLADTWSAAPPGKDLWAHNEVHTLPAARAELTFRDDAILRMEAEALVVIYGPSPWKPRPPRTGTVTLVEGDLRLRLPALRGDAPALALTTPGARVETKGADAHVGVDAAKTSRVSVFDGRATVAAAGATVAVAKGWGTKVPKGKVPDKPVRLLPAPVWVAPGPGAVRVAVDAPGAPVALEWTEVPGATRYRVELARDADMNDTVADESRVGGHGGARRVETGELDPGRYWARVYAVDGRGLRGMPSEVRAVDVVAVALEYGSRDGDVLRGKGAVRLGGMAGVDVWVDGAKAETPAIVTGEGKHEVRIGPAGAEGALLLVEVEKGKAPGWVTRRPAPAAATGAATATGVAAAARTGATAGTGTAATAAAGTGTAATAAAGTGTAAGAPTGAGTATVATTASDAISGALGPVTPRPDPPASPHPTRARAIGAWLAGVGSAGLVAAVLTGTRTKVLRDELDAALSETPADLARAADLERRGRTMAAATGVLLAGSGFMAATGLTVLLVGFAGRW